MHIRAALHAKTPRNWIGCYTRPAMRRWFLIFLVVLLPVQLSWAAVASYCQHESGTTAQHLGHHEHQHEAGAAPSNDGDPHSKSKAAGTVDLDCGTCHAGTCSAMVQSLNLVMVKLPSETHSATALRLSSRPASLPERPNWADLA